MFLTETLYPGGYTPGYTESLCRRISSSVSGIQAGVILTRIPRVNRRFRCSDRGIFVINQGGDNGAAFMDHPEGAGSGRGDRVDFHSRVRLEFRGTQPGSDGGLPVIRERDDAEVMPKSW